jgi:hypothetical protein
MDASTATKTGVPPYTKRGVYYAQAAYANLTGQLMSVQLPADIPGIAAMASWDAPTKTARVIVGAYTDPSMPDPLIQPPPVRLALENLPTTFAPGTVLAVAAMHIADTEVPTPAGTKFPPPSTTQFHATVSSDRSVTFDLEAPTYGAAFCNAQWGPTLVIKTPCSDAWSVELKEVVRGQ